MHFICISGHAQNGKDTSALMIKQELECYGYSVLITHYADLLKFICKSFFDWNGEKDEAGRTLLQCVGTECIRKQNPNFWVNFITEVISFFPTEWDYVIIPDARFPNEISEITDAGYTVTHIRVMREGFLSPLTKEQQGHASETALDNIKPDILLINSTIEKLYYDIKNVCRTIIDKQNHMPVQLSIMDEENI